MPPNFKSKARSNGVVRHCARSASGQSRRFFSGYYRSGLPPFADRHANGLRCPRKQLGERDGLSAGGRWIRNFGSAMRSHRRERPRPRSHRPIQRKRRLLEGSPSDPIGWSGRNCSAEPPRLGSIGSNSDQGSKPLNIGRRNRRFESSSLQR